MIDSVAAAESAQKDVALERSLAEVESLKSRLHEVRGTSVPFLFFLRVKNLIIKQ